LYHTSRNSKTAITDLLLAKGADVHAKDKEIIAMLRARMLEQAGNPSGSGTRFRVSLS
jgi:hypothetical protein